jgi:hypothetical protein
LGWCALLRLGGVPNQDLLRAAGLKAATEFLTADQVGGAVLG